MMKVLILSEALWPHGGGGELATYLFAKLLSEQGIRVKVITGRNSLLKEHFDFDVYVIRGIGYGKYSIPSLNSIEPIKRLISWADVIYFTGLFNLIPLVKSFGKPMIVHIHSYFPVCPVGHLYNFAYKSICLPNNRSCLKCVLLYEFFQRSLKQAISSCILNCSLGKMFLKYVLMTDALIFVSKAQRSLFQNHVCYLGTSSKQNVPSRVIYNPLPDVRLLTINNDDVGFLGGLNPIKGFHVLLRSWLKVYKKFVRTKLRMAMCTALPTKLKRLNIVKYHRLMGKELENFYGHCRVIVVPSICPEPSPYVSIEACLRGRILIASNIGGIPEIVGGAPGVRLIPPGDVDALVDALDWALSMDRRDVVELGLRNREYVLRRFDNERSVRELIRVFEDVLR